MPHVKQFVKGREAETYENVSVKYIEGSNAILKIYETYNNYRDLVEVVNLASYRSVAAMHKMMVEKGFTRKHEKEVEFLLELGKEDVKTRKQKRKEELQYKKMVNKIRAEKFQEARLKQVEEALQRFSTNLDGSPEVVESNTEDEENEEHSETSAGPNNETVAANDAAGGLAEAVLSDVVSDEL